jgi:hypothetical protein
MGQRLNMEIYAGGEAVANCYFHWSGYTRSALRHTAKLITAFHAMQEKKESFPTDTELAIVLFQRIGAGVHPGEISEAEKIMTKEAVAPASSRNDGLISITKKGMEETTFWQEASVHIDLYQEEVGFQAHFPTDDEGYLEMRSDDGEYSIQELHDQLAELPTLRADLEQFSFDHINLLLEDIFSTYPNHWTFRLPSEQIVDFIE